MNEPANYWKLGLFVVLGMLTMTTGIVYLGSIGLRKETVEYTSYFDESVTGLDVGSPVRFRGVKVGHVSAIDIAPDRRHVRITYKLGVSVLANVGLDARPGQNNELTEPPDLRAQLGSAGLVGVKYILIDFFDVKNNPPPKLSFPTPKNHIPAASSTMKNLEDSLMLAIDQFPGVSNQVTTILNRIDNILVNIDDTRLSDKVAATLANLDRTLANWDQTLAVARKTLNNADTAGLSNEAKAALANLNVTIIRAQSLIARVDGDKGVLASVQRAWDSIGDVAVDGRDYGKQFSDALQDLSDAANSIRALSDALELDSDMLLKGRSKENP
jgi:ABC-type transporter Mla subunit MlaD